MESNKHCRSFNEDYSCYTWYKGEVQNPYEKDTFHPLAATFWDSEHTFHTDYLKHKNERTLKSSYNSWKKDFIERLLPDSHPFEDGSNINWEKVFATGMRQELE